MEKLKELIFTGFLGILLISIVIGIGSCHVYLCKQKYVGASTIGCLFTK